MAIAANNARKSITTTDFFIAASLPTVIPFRNSFDTRAPGQDSSNGKKSEEGIPSACRFIPTIVRGAHPKASIGFNVLEHMNGR